MIIMGEKKKFIRDSVYGDISLNKFEQKVLDMPQFQRLRRIKQLGLINLIYPGANHTRFEHSIGTMNLGSKLANNALQEAGYDVLAVGKIHDIFDGYGITKSLHSTSSVHGMDQTIALAQSDFCGLCFTNLVDFDALWGHRRNPIGYGEEIERFDKKLGELMPLLKKEDLLMITADHGNDPTYKGTDHTREQVPLLLYSPSDQGSGPLPTQDTFAVIGATIADNFGVQMPANTIGTSLLPLL